MNYVPIFFVPSAFSCPALFPLRVFMVLSSAGLFILIHLFPGTDLLALSRGFWVEITPSYALVYSALPHLSEHMSS